MTGMLLQLEPLDYEVLADVLRRAMADLREEIYKTDAAEYRTGHALSCSAP